MNESVGRQAAALRELVFTGRTLAVAGVARADRPDRAVRAVLALRRWGPTPAGGYATAAARTPNRTAIDDERGQMSFEQVHRRTNALARGLRAAGVGPGDGVAILARNHRGFVAATVACSKLGADAIYVNTSFAAPEIAGVLDRENPRALIHDDEFTGAVAGTEQMRPTFVAWRDGSRAAGLDDLIAAHSGEDLAPPRRRGRVVILTSGTTGTPRGAARRQPDSLGPAAALLAEIPLRAREATVIAAPLFHSWGFAHFSLGLALSSTLVLRRRFDAAGTLAAAAETRATALIVVPVMLQRMLELGPAALAAQDLSRLRVIAASGSALPGDLGTRTMDAFGEVLYNLYGSTEVAWVTVATPGDLRAAPGTAGRPPRGTRVRLLDAHDDPVARGATGRIFAGNELVFDGYTGAADDGPSKAVVDGLMSTGDVGHVDREGRLFVDGREDEMIVSGGENVFPREVEDLLAAQAEIVEAAVVGVADAQFGQRLKAFVVKAGESDLDEAEVKRRVRENLAAFKVPREVVFVPRLPRNATGKVVKRDLYP